LQGRVVPMRGKWCRLRKKILLQTIGLADQQWETIQSRSQKVSVIRTMEKVSEILRSI
jgi:hypothetical protein